MDTPDALALADLAVRLGLLRPDQVMEAWNEFGKKGGEAAPFLRVMERKGYLTPFQSNKLLKGDADGYVLGGYRLLYKIASGSFGRVFRSDDPQTGRGVAVKVLRKKWSEKKTAIEQFEREGRIGMTLKHPNIVEVLAVNQDRATKQYYIVMEFVEGGNLRDILKIRNKMEPGEALKLMEECAAGLAFAFSRGLTHRDVKTTNVLLSTNGVGKLVDFGLADLVDKTAKSEDGVEVDRTVDYAGLERATGAPHGDTRSDIFFLGCIGFQLLTGRSPLEWSRNPRARMEERRFTKITPMSPDELKAPQSVFRLIDRMMTLSVNERYQTPSQLVEAIREVRREVEGGPGAGAPKPAQVTLFVVEKNEQLQDLLREKLKERGFKVLIAGDPQRAIERFKQNPFNVFIVNAGSTGEDGLYAFESVMEDARRQSIPLAGILLVTPEQAVHADKFTELPRVELLVHPVKFRDLLGKINQVLEVPQA